MWYHNSEVVIAVQNLWHLMQAWSNGRLHAPLHKVTLSEDKDRYTFALFIMPKEDQVVEAPRELVDDEHPPHYRTFIFKDFLHCSFIKHAVEGTLEEFAGIWSDKVWLAKPDTFADGGLIWLVLCISLYDVLFYRHEWSTVLHYMFCKICFNKMRDISSPFLY